jgi:pimeloyl-ACP methyl ester carboxylesterase
MERFIDDITSVIEALDLPAVHLVGHSLGAFVTLAARTTNRVSVEIKSATSVAGTEQAIQRYPVLRVGARIFSSKIGLWLLKRQNPGRAMIATWFGPNPTKSQLDEVRLLSAQCSHQTRAAIRKATGDLDLRPSFSAGGPPTLIMCGRSDKAPPLSHTERLAGAIHAELAVIDDAGHMVIVEQPEKLVAGLTDFIHRNS